jgi:hypothetical protein
VLAYTDASQEMVDMAGGRLGDRARVRREDVLDLVLDEPVDVVVSTATLHWGSRPRPAVAATCRRAGFVRSSILPAHPAHLPADCREPFTAAVRSC